MSFSVSIGHAWQVSPFAPLNPALQKHADCDVLASSELAFTGHISQDDDPLLSLYVVARHATHMPPLALDHPTLHVQASAAMLCHMIGECEFAVHGVHMPELRVVLYDLAPHPVQVPPSRPDVQSIRLSLAAGESEFDGHAWHGSVLAPISVENLPVSHSVHTASPGFGLYLPATHCVQEPPSGPVQPTLHVQFVIILLA